MISSKIHDAPDSEAIKGVHVYRTPVFYLHRVPWAVVSPVFLWKYMDYVVKRYKIDLVHLQDIAFPCAFFASLYCKRKHIPCVTTVRGSYFGLGWGFVPDLILDLYVLTFGRLTLKLVERVATISKGQIPILVRLGVPRSKITFAPLGIDTDASAFRKATEQERIKARQRLNLNKEDFVMGFAGRLAPDKNVGLLIDVAKALSRKIANLKLLLVGSGVEEASLKDKASKLAISNTVVFLGWREDVDKLLPAMDVFAFPSLSDGLGRAFVEAMTVGVPVVSTNVPGPSSVIVHENNGLLVPRNNVDAMASAIMRLYEDKALRRQLSERGTEVKNVFSWDSCISMLENMYNTTLESHKFGQRE